MAQANRILASLPQNIIAAVERQLQPVALKFGDVIAETGNPVTRVYFPHSGVVSLVVEMEVGSMIETAMVGRDGVVNGTSALDGNVALHKAIVQVEADLALDRLSELARDVGRFVGAHRVLQQRQPCHRSGL